MITYLFCPCELLRLNNNDFDGTIGPLAGLTSLHHVDLSNNQLTGVLMDASNLTNLESFKVDGNQLSGSVPMSFVNITSLGMLTLFCTIKFSHSLMLTFFWHIETLHIQRNQFSGAIEFMCHDLPSDLILDCDGDKPEVQCNCCIGCTIVDDEECDPESEQLILLVVDAGNSGNGFKWELHGSNEGLIAAGGEYENNLMIGIQLCLSFPGEYTLSLSVDIDDKVAGIWYYIGNFSSSIKPYHTFINEDYFSFSNEGMLVTAAPTSSPTDFPTSSPSRTPSPTPLTTVLKIHPLPVTSFPVTSQSPTLMYAPPLPATLPGACSGPEFVLNLTTDAFGIDTSWDVFNTNNNSTFVTNSSLASNETYSFNKCLHPGGCYEFVIQDDWNDGICCQQGQGSYNISVNGRLLGSGGAFGSSEITYIGGNCGVNATEELLCPEKYSLLNVTVVTDGYGHETSWEVFDALSGQIYATNEYNLRSHRSESLVKCIPLKDCYQFTIYDGYSDGGAEWIVEYGGKLAGSGDGDYARSDFIAFGSRCQVDNTI